MRIPACLLLLLSLSSCGQAGPLYLPDRPPPPAPRPTVGLTPTTDSAPADAGRTKTDGQDDDTKAAPSAGPSPAQ